MSRSTSTRARRARTWERSTSPGRSSTVGARTRRSTSPCPVTAGGCSRWPAFGPGRNRLDVAIPHIRATYAQIYLYSLRPDLSLAGQTTVPAGLGDRFENELSIDPNGRIGLSFYDRGYSGNRLVDL